MLGLRFLDKGDLLHRLLDGSLQVLHINRLHGEVESSMVHGRTDIIHIAIGRNHDTFHGRIAHLVDLRKQRQAIHLRHVDVAQDNIKIRMLQDQLERL